MKRVRTHATAGEAEAVRLAGLGVERQQLALLEHPRLTLPQRAFCSHTSKSLLWLGGNSIGKSYAHAWDIVHFLRGTHPWRETPRPPVEILVAGYSYAQMDPLLAKLWALGPRSELDPKLYYRQGQGIRGYKEPVLRLVRGPGAGSVAYLVTYKQGAQRIMGFQGHRISLDEPPPQEVYREALPRLNRHRGELRVSMTPTLESPPLDYIEEELKAGKLDLLQTSYNRANITVQGGLVPWAWKTDEEIEKDLGKYDAEERPMREHGHLRPALMGRALEKVTSAHFTDEPLPDGDWLLAVGIDHGTRPGRQCAVLVALEINTGALWLLDETPDTGQATTTEDDAKHILAMLDRCDVKWEEVDFWVGDRATSDSFWGDAKSNIDLHAELASLLGLTQRELGARGLRIQTARKNKGSPRRGVAALNNLAGKDLFRARKRCVRFDAARREWKGEKASHHKDVVDPIRYAHLRLLDASRSSAKSSSGRME